MIRKIQCFVMALCLLLTAAFGLRVPMTVSAAETDDFEIMYERCYEQTIGAKPGEALDTSNEYVAAFVQNVDKTANENWAIMNKSDDTDRTEIFQGIKPEVGVRPNKYGDSESDDDIHVSEQSGKGICDAGNHAVPE